MVIFDEADRVLLVRHSYRKQDEWHVPTGGVGAAEDIEAAARRELREEVGLAPPRLIEAHNEVVPMHGASNLVTVFAARTTEHPRPDDREIAEARFFDTTGLPAMTPPWARHYVEKGRLALEQSSRAAI